MPIEENSMKLFIVYVGGETETSNVELHDVRFCIGEKIEDCYDELKKQWWGTPRSLHLDCWGALEYADGYNISLSKTAPTNQEHQLYFVNLGGYNTHEFTEQHKNMFVVDIRENKAKVKALKTVQDWNSPHKDFQYDIEKAVCLNEAIESYGYHLVLEETSKEKEFTFTCGYTPIGK